MDRLTDPDKPELKIDLLKPSFYYNMLSEKMNLAPKPFQPTHRM